MTDTDIEFLLATEHDPLYRTKAVLPVEVVQAIFQQIERTRRPLNAIPLDNHRPSKGGCNVIGKTISPRKRK